MSAEFMGRVYLYDTGDGPEYADFFCYELLPMERDGSNLCRGIAEWAEDYFKCCMDDDKLRKMFGLTKEGNFQVVFKGSMFSDRDYWGEYSEDFELDSYIVKPMPKEEVDLRLGPPAEDDNEKI